MSEIWNNQKSQKYKKAAVYGSVMLSAILCLIKTFAAFQTNSLAIFSSLIDSLSDIVASVISFIAVKFSLKPADCNYRYGYLKAESLSAFVQSVFIASSGIFVLYSGINRFLHPSTLEKTNIGLLIMILSLALTFFLIFFQKYVAKHTLSPAIKADMAHYATDILTNVGIIASLFLVQTFHLEWLDTICATIIAFYLIYYAYKIAKEAIFSLMDKELDLEIRKHVTKLIMETKSVKGYHDFRSRDMGGVYYFELHLELDGNLSLLEAHRLTDIVEQKIKSAYPKSQVLIHEDPYGIKEERLDDTLEGKCQI